MTNHGRLIDADALIEQMEADAEHFDNAISKMMYYAAISDVKHAPTIESERKKGKWIADNHDFWVCSNCKFPSEAHGANILYKFCPNCGADMRGETE